MNIPPNTCPMIDALIKVIEDSYRIAYTVRERQDLSAEEASDMLREIEYNLRHESQKLEELRTANLQLRDAVHHYKLRVDELELRVNELEWLASE